jgi:hypothetical protein
MERTSARSVIGRVTVASELPPGRPGPTRCWIDPGRLRYLPYRRRLLHAQPHRDVRVRADVEVAHDAALFKTRRLDGGEQTVEGADGPLDESLGHRSLLPSSRRGDQAFLAQLAQCLADGVSADPVLRAQLVFAGEGSPPPCWTRQAASSASTTASRDGRARDLVVTG